jgi:hypothetical protein
LLTTETTSHLVILLI